MKMTEMEDEVMADMYSWAYGYYRGNRGPDDVPTKEMAEAYWKAKLQDPDLTGMEIVG